MSETNNSVKSALRTLDILELVVTRPTGVVAQDIADALSIPVSSLSYLLGTLVERGYLERIGRRYLAGPSLERLRRAPERQSLADLSRPLIRMLRQKVNETSSLFEPVGWEIEAKVTETAAQSLSYQISVGRRTPMHCTAAGKAFLAALPADELESYLAQTERPRLTETTVCEADALRHELTGARAAGHARTDGDYLLGIAGLGVVVRAQDRPVAAISVALPSVRLLPDHERAIVAELHRTAQALEAMLA